MHGTLLTVRNGSKIKCTAGGAAASNAVLMDWLPGTYNVWSRIQEWRLQRIRLAGLVKLMELWE